MFISVDQPYDRTGKSQLQAGSASTVGSAVYHNYFLTLNQIQDKFSAEEQLRANEKRLCNADVDSSLREVAYS